MRASLCAFRSAHFALRARAQSSVDSDKNTTITRENATKEVLEKQASNKQTARARLASKNLQRKKNFRSFRAVFVSFLLSSLLSFFLIFPNDYSTRIRYSTSSKRRRYTDGTAHRI
jgi:hypothetical protein